MNSWLPADGRDHTIIVRLGNGGGLGTSGDFRFYSGGSPVWQYSYHPWGWQDFGWQVYVTFVVNPDTGKCQVKDFWHAH